MTLVGVGVKIWKGWIANWYKPVHLGVRGCNTMKGWINSGEKLICSKKYKKSETAKKYAVSLPMGLSSYKLVTSPPSSSLPLPLITVSRVITRNVFVHCIFNWRGSLKNYPEQGQCIAKLKLGLRWLQKGRATHFCLPAKGFARRGWRGGSFIRKWRLPSSWASTNYFTDIQ